MPRVEKRPVTTLPARDARAGWFHILLQAPNVRCHQPRRGVPSSSAASSVGAASADTATGSKVAAVATKAAEAVANVAISVGTIALGVAAGGLLLAKITKKD